MTKNSVTRGTKFFALLLIIGGFAGIVAGLWGDIQTIQRTGFHPSASLSFTAVFILLFGWSTWVGVALWEGKPQGYKWAKVLFAAQIPVFTVPGLAFSGFRTGLGFYVFVSREPPNLGFNFQLLSAIHFLISGDVDNVLFGVNLVAIIALTYLHSVTMQEQKRGDKFGLI